MKREFKGLTKRSRELLGLQESDSVEFKQSHSAVERDDIVAFANSTDGGTILVGVAESEGKNEKQSTDLVGCEVGDRAIQALISRAEACVPPVAIQVFIENLDRTPILRIEIPPSASAPHCTTSGTYKRRIQGRIQPLLPEALLEMFLERETEKFESRFSLASQRLEVVLQNLQTRLALQTTDLSDTVDTMAESVEESLKRLLRTAESAEGTSEEGMTIAELTRDDVDEVFQRVFETDRSVDHALRFLMAIADKLDVEDPKRTEAKSYAAMSLAFFKNRGRDDAYEHFLEEILESNPWMEKEELIQLSQSYTSDPD